MVDIMTDCTISMMNLSQKSVVSKIELRRLVSEKKHNDVNDKMLQRRMMKYGKSKEVSTQMK